MPEYPKRETLNDILTQSTQLADQVTQACDEATLFRQECQDLKSKIQIIAGILRRIERARVEPYERPTRRITDETDQVVKKASRLVSKCIRNNFIKRTFNFNSIRVSSFQRISQQLDNSIGDVSWLLDFSTSSGDNVYYSGYPPIAARTPFLSLIWEQVGILYKGSMENRSDAADLLGSLATNSNRNGKLIIEECGVPALLKLIKEGTMEGQENAARAILLIGKDPESVEHIMNAGVGVAFGKVLQDGDMKVQAVIAWAVSELVTHHQKCQGTFSRNHVVKLLSNHLAFETVEERNKYDIIGKRKITTHEEVGSGGATWEIGESSRSASAKGKKVSSGTTSEISIIGSSETIVKRREDEDPATKIYMKEMAAKALSVLCKDNASICRIVGESRALLSFAILAEKATDDLQHYSITAMLVISAMADQDSELRHAVFKPTSPGAAAVVTQLLRLVQREDPRYFIPSIQALGNLARIFRTTETRVISQLVRLLEDREPEVMSEALLALTKFTCDDNYLHINHSTSIIRAGGLRHLIQLVYLGEESVQVLALILLSYITLNVPESEELATQQVLSVLKWALKQANLNRKVTVVTVLPEAKRRLEVYMFRNEA